MSYLDEHERAPGRVGKLRDLRQIDTRPGNKSAAYKKSECEARCDFCGDLCFVDSMEDMICKACVIDLRRGT